MPAPSSFHINVRVSSSNTSNGTVTTGAGDHISSTYICSNIERNVSRFNIVAQPASGCTFSGWTYSTSGVPSGGSASAVFGNASLASTNVLGKAVCPEPASPYESEKVIYIYVTAHFYRPTYSIDVSVSPTGKGTVSGGGTYGSGATVTLTATDSVTGYTFNRWKDVAGTTVSTLRTYTFTASSNRSIIGEFKGISSYVVLDDNGGTGGKGSINATYGSAMPSLGGKIPVKPNYDFNGYWNTTSSETGSAKKYYNADGSSATNWDQVAAVGSSITLYAHWKVKSYTITVSSGNTTMGSAKFSDGTALPKVVNYNTLTTVVATTTANCYKFVNWTDGTKTSSGDDWSSTSASYSFRATADRSLKANFRKDPNYIYKNTTGGNATYRVRLVTAVKSGQSACGSVSSSLNSGYVNITGSGISNTVSGDIEATANFGYTFKQWTFTGPTHTTWDSSISTSHLFVDNLSSAKTTPYTSTKAKVATKVTGLFAGAPSNDGKYQEKNNLYYTATAEFTANTYYLTVNKNVNTRGSVKGYGNYETGTSVKIEATANAGYYFDHWILKYEDENGHEQTQTSSSNPWEFKMVPNKATATAYFYVASLGKYKTRLYVQSGDTTQGTITKGSGYSSYSNGDTDITIDGNWSYTPTVAVEATPKTGYTFDHWSYELGAKSNVNFDADKTEVVVEPTGAGQTLRKASISARGGLKLVGLTNKAYTTSERYTIKLIAQFAGETYQISTSTVPSDGSYGTVTGGGQAATGEEKTITATPKPGYKIQTWQKWIEGQKRAEIDASTLADPKKFTFTMPANDIGIIAIFSPIALSDYKVGIHITSSAGGNASKEDTYYSDYSDITVAGVRKYFTVENVTVTALPGYAFSEWEVTLEREPAQWVPPTSTSSPKSSWRGWATDNPYSTGNTYDLNTEVFYVGTTNGDYIKDRNVLIKFNAKFVKLTDVPYHVSFQAVAGTGGIITQGGATQNSAIRELGTTVGIYNSPINCQPNTGYYFTGWTWLEPTWTNEYASSSYLNKSLSSASTTASNLATIEARWNKKSGVVYDEDGESISVKIRANFSNQYTATFNKTGGTGGTNAVTATYGSAMPTITIPHRSGYKFVGYFDARNGNVKYYNEDGTSARVWDRTSNATLYAHWELAGAKIKVLTSAGWKECGGIKKCTSISGGTPTWVKAPVMKAKNTSTSIIWT